jgi:hypothetical protein
LVARGYQKLTSFECTNQTKHAKEGYEWFGGTAPAHEALTAYGLLQFRDMARVQDVDPQMLERTKQYLLSQRDGKGGFKRNLRALDTFGRAPDDITNAYIIWALTEGGKDDDVSVELSALRKQAESSKDPYFLSLVANSLINRDQTADAILLLKKVAEAQKADGHLDAERTSITGSGGRDLQIETTALGVLGWLKANNPGEFNASVQKAVKWIGQQRGGYGGFGSTQSTILALKALIAYTRANKRTPSPGELKLYVGDREVATCIPCRCKRGADTCRARRGEGVQAGLQQGADRGHREERIPLHSELDLFNAAACQRRELPGSPDNEVGRDPGNGGRWRTADSSGGKQERQRPGHGGGDRWAARRPHRARRPEAAKGIYAEAG